MTPEKLRAGRTAPKRIIPEGETLPARAAARFWAKVEKHDADCPCCNGCWHWTASHNENGYARFSIKPRIVRAHRLAYELLVGPIPAGYDLDHLCRNRGCVNPAHLEPVTPRANLQRSGPHKGALSQYRGVTRWKGYSGWIAQTQVMRQTYWRGPFSSEIEAAQAAIELRREHMPYAIEEDILAA